MYMDSIKTYAAPLGRLLMCSLFIWAGYTKLFVFGPSGTAGYMASVNMPLPALAAWVAIIVELVGGILLLIGYQTRWVALVLAIWCVVTGLAVHLPVGDQANMVHFFKNLVMAGGFLFVVAHGAGGLSVDGAMGTDKAA
jgi:putative oxidoreductase